LIRRSKEDDANINDRSSRSGMHGAHDDRRASRERLSALGIASRADLPFAGTVLASLRVLIDCHKPFLFNQLRIEGQSAN
jgi:hypothetical protein